MQETFPDETSKESVEVHSAVVMPEGAAEPFQYLVLPEDCYKMAAGDLLVIKIDPSKIQTMQELDEFRRSLDAFSQKASVNILTLSKDMDVETLDDAVMNRIGWYRRNQILLANATPQL